MSEESALVVRGSMIPSVEVITNMQALATAVVKSGLCPKGIDTPEKALVVMVKGYELGIGIMQSMSDLYVVHGRPSMSTKLMMALYRAAGHRFVVLHKDPDRCRIRFILRDGQTFEHEMTREEATEARFDQQWNAEKRKWEVKHTWRGMPKLMLFYRTMSSGVRLYASDALFNTLTRDEAESLFPEELDAARVNGLEVVDAEYAVENDANSRGDYDQPTREERIQNLEAELARLREEEAQAPAEAEQQMATGPGGASDDNGTAPLVTGSLHWAEDVEKRQSILQAMDEYSLNDRDARQALSEDCGEKVVQLTDYTRDQKACLKALRLFAKKREEEVGKAEQGSLV